MKLRAACLLAALAIGVPLVVWICGRWPAPSPAQLALEAEQRLLRALNEKTAVEAHQVPLGELLERLEIRHGVEIEIAEPSLIGNAAREPVSLILSGVSLRAALSWILGQLDLDYFCRDGKILVTTDASNREDPANLVARVYPLLAAPAGWRSSGDEARNLLAGSLQRIVADDDGPSLNESGELLAVPNALVAVQLPHIQERIEFLLGQMASAEARRDTCAPIQLSATDNSPAELDLRVRLARRVARRVLSSVAGRRLPLSGRRLRTAHRLGSPSDAGGQDRDEFADHDQRARHPARHGSDRDARSAGS